MGCPVPHGSTADQDTLQGLHVHLALCPELTWGTDMDAGVDMFIEEDTMSAPPLPQGCLSPTCKLYTSWCAWW